MPKLSLKICQVNTAGEVDGYVGFFPQAVDILNQKFQAGEIENVSLSGRRPFRAIDELIGYRVTKTQKYARRQIPIIEGLNFSTSYFVGQAVIHVPGCESNVEIDITPDLSDSWRNHLLQYACGVYLPHDLGGASNTSGTASAWLLLLMWRCAFERAIRRGSIPREYIAEEKNLRFFRGRLDVLRQIQMNLTDQSRFYCQYAPLSMDITINRVIRYVFKLITNAAGIDKSAFRSLAAHDDMLASFGVSNAPVLPEQIDRIHYHRMNSMYRPLMQLSKAIIRKFGACDRRSSTEFMSYFVDWSEVWENYLLKIMQKNIPDYTFISPNDSAENIPLLKCGRGIRPDFLVYRGSELIAVMDAKYKKYERIGGKDDFSRISRDDLYQMSTYLYHYSKPGKKLLGIFLARGKGNEESEFENGNAKILLRNFEIPNDVSTIESKEKDWAQILNNDLHSVATGG